MLLDKKAEDLLERMALEMYRLVNDSVPLTLEQYKDTLRKLYTIGYQEGYSDGKCEGFQEGIGHILD